MVKHTADLDERACTAIKKALSKWKQPREIKEVINSPSWSLKLLTWAGRKEGRKEMSDDNETGVRLFEIQLDLSIQHLQHHSATFPDRKMTRLRETWGIYRDVSVGKFLFDYLNLRQHRDWALNTQTDNSVKEKDLKWTLSFLSHMQTLRYTPYLSWAAVGGAISNCSAKNRKKKIQLPPVT